MLNSIYITKDPTIKQNKKQEQQAAATSNQYKMLKKEFRCEEEAAFVSKA